MCNYVCIVYLPVKCESSKFKQTDIGLPPNLQILIGIAGCLDPLWPRSYPDIVHQPRHQSKGDGTSDSLSMRAHVYSCMFMHMLHIYIYMYICLCTYVYVCLCGCVAIPMNQENHRTPRNYQTIAYHCYEMAQTIDNYFLSQHLPNDMGQTKTIPRFPSDGRTCNFLTSSVACFALQKGLGFVVALPAAMPSQGFTSGLFLGQNGSSSLKRASSSSSIWSSSQHLKNDRQQ